MQLITGRTGEQHVRATDDAELHRALLGDGDFVLTTGAKFNAQMNGAYQMNIYSGTAIMQGRQVKIRQSEGFNSVAFDNGVAGYKRWDIVVIEYSKEDDIEKAELKVIKGENRASYIEPVVPHLNGNIDNGEVHQMKLWGVRYNGLNFDGMVDYRTVLDTSPVNTLLASVDAMKSEITARIIEIQNMAVTVPQFIIEAEDVKTEGLKFNLEKPLGYSYQDTDLFELYLNGLLCRQAGFTVSVNDQIEISLSNDTDADYNEVILKIWKIKED